MCARSGQRRSHHDHRLGTLSIMKKASILLVTSNGTGMGHLTRQSSIARALGTDADVFILSMSAGITVLDQSEFRTEFLPSYQKRWMPRRDWHQYLRQRIVALAREIQADVICFDGVAPYEGLIRSRSDLPQTAFVWFRRGLWRPGTNLPALRSAPFFDLIIEPGDLGQSRDQGPTKDLAAARIAPVSLLDVLDTCDRDEARLALGLPTEGKIALVSLGSGAVGLDAELREAACAHVLDQGWQVATTQAILEGSMSAANGVHVLQRIYPLARYIKAFDLVVSAAGYNAVHEFVPAGIPSVFVPNTHTSTDDQVARAQGCHDAGLAEWSHPDVGIAGLTAAIDQAITNSAQISQTIQRRAAGARGSQEAAALLLKLATTFGTDHPSLPTRAKRNQFLWQQDAKRLLRSMISTKIIPARRKIAEPADLLEVNLEISLESMPSGVVADSTTAESSPNSDGQLTLRQTSELTTDLVQGSDPFEHISPNTSLAYWQERTAILHRFYRIKSTSMSTRK